MVRQWDTATIGDFLDFKNGLNKGKEFFGYGTPIVNYTDVYKKRGLKKADIRGRVCLTPDEIHRFNVRKNDVFFTRTSETPDEVGMSSVLLEDVENGVFSGFVLRGRPKNDMLVPEYCKYCFSTETVRNAIITGCTYTTRALTNGKQLSAIEILVPPKPEQEAIAAALSDIDALIANLEKLIAKKKDIKQGAMQELLTGRRRLPGFSGQWTEYALSDFVECIRGVSYDGSADLNQFETAETVRLLRSNNIKNARFVDADVQYVYRNKVKLSQYLCVDDIMVCMANGSRSLVGKSCYFEKPFIGDYTFGAFMSCIRKKDSDTNMYYIFNLMNSDSYWNQIAILFSGSSINNLRPTDILNMRFLFPLPNEQTAICEVIQDMESEILDLEGKLCKYQRIMLGMMSELLTGRIRLL